MPTVIRGVDAEPDDASILVRRLRAKFIDGPESHFFHQRAYSQGINLVCFECPWGYLELSALPICLHSAHSLWLI
jgi:hypothetical protein